MTVAANLQNNNRIWERIINRFIISLCRYHCQALEKSYNIVALCYRVLCKYYLCPVAWGCSVDIEEKGKQT